MGILVCIYLVTLFLHNADANICPKQTLVNKETVTPGRSLLLECNLSIISSTPTVYTWAVLSGDQPTLAWDEIVIHETETGNFSYPNEEMYSRRKFQYNGVTHGITIRNATEADQGCYKCAAVASGSGTTVFSVSVSEHTTAKPKTTVQPSPEHTTSRPKTTPEPSSEHTTAKPKTTVHPSPEQTTSWPKTTAKPGCDFPPYYEWRLIFVIILGCVALFVAILLLVVCIYLKKFRAAARKGSYPLTDTMDDYPV